jgi:hypothetical protein
MGVITITNGRHTSAGMEQGMQRDGRDRRDGRDGRDGGQAPNPLLATSTCASSSPSGWAWAPVQQTAPLRNGLIKKEMKWRPSHGQTAFTVPMFDAFMGAPESCKGLHEDRGERRPQEVTHVGHHGRSAAQKISATCRCSAAAARLASAMLLAKASGPH